jgi:DNA-binding MarR family transcriptional regulator/GNAT superfamily N-acetyltransferase
MGARATSKDSGGRVGQVRAFNRFYTKRIGLLGDGYLDSPFNLTEARVLYELAQRQRTEVAELRRGLGLDPGYLSRILAGFERRGLITRRRSGSDRRRQLVGLTRRGRGAIRTLDSRSSSELAGLLAEHSDEAQRRLVQSMGSIQSILGAPPDEGRVVLRAPELSDHGWVLESHGQVYREQRDWDAPAFLGLVARVIADSLAEHDPARERAWIAELGGERVGVVYCTRRARQIAQLRLLLVVPWARGAGVGAALVSECVRFARDAGYRQMMLWTNSRLASARRIYEAEGFQLRAEQADEVFGSGSLAQEFWLDL